MNTETNARAEHTARAAALTTDDLVAKLLLIAGRDTTGPMTAAVMVEAASRLVHGLPAEKVSNGCAYENGDCTGLATTREDPYESDVNNTPGVMIRVCDYHYQAIADDI